MSNLTSAFHNRQFVRRLPNRIIEQNYNKRKDLHFENTTLQDISAYLNLRKVFVLASVIW